MYKKVSILLCNTSYMYMFQSSVLGDQYKESYVLEISQTAMTSNEKSTETVANTTSAYSGIYTT